MITFTAKKGGKIGQNFRRYILKIPINTAKIAVQNMLL